MEGVGGRKAVLLTPDERLKDGAAGEDQPGVFAAIGWGQGGMRGALLGRGLAMLRGGVGGGEFDVVHGINAHKSKPFLWVSKQQERSATPVWVGLNNTLRSRPPRPPDIVVDRFLGEYLGSASDTETDYDVSGRDDWGWCAVRASSALGRGCA